MTYKLEIYLPKNIIPTILESSEPLTGEKNTVNYGKEYKLEIRCEETYVKSVLQKIRELHPYEEALINVIRLDNGRFE